MFSALNTAAKKPCQDEQVTVQLLDYFLLC